MQFKISGQKTDAMSAGREKIDDGEKEFGGWAGNVFLMKKMARELLAEAFWQPTGRHAAITLRCLKFAAFKACACTENRQCSVAARLINENGGSSYLRSPGPVPMHIDSLCDWP